MLWCSVRVDDCAEEDCLRNLSFVTTQLERAQGSAALPKRTVEKASTRQLRKKRLSSKEALLHEGYDNVTS